MQINLLEFQRILIILTLQKIKLSPPFSSLCFSAMFYLMFQRLNNKQKLWINLNMTQDFKKKYYDVIVKIKYNLSLWKHTHIYISQKIIYYLLIRGYFSSYFLLSEITQKILKCMILFASCAVYSHYNKNF